MDGLTGNHSSSSQMTSQQCISFAWRHKQPELTFEYGIQNSSKTRVRD